MIHALPRLRRLWVASVTLFVAVVPALAQTTRVSVSGSGAEGNSFSFLPAVAADGAFIAFASNADNLVPNDTNRLIDVFVHERATGRTSRVSVGTDGSQGGGHEAALSANGRFVALGSFGALAPEDVNQRSDIYLHDRLLATTALVSVASDGTGPNGPSADPDISSDGRFVAFYSDASNLTPGDVNERTDVFVRDLLTGQTTLVSVADGGGPANSVSSSPAISEDGRYVAFMSIASNLVPGDTNDRTDVFVRDLVNGTTTRVSVASDGRQADAGSLYPAISGDGRYVAFDGNATNLVAGDTNGVGDIFVHDRTTGHTTRASVASGGAQANIQSIHPALNRDGRFVAFASFATNLVPGDTNGMFDVFVHDLHTGQTERISVANDGTQGNDASGIDLMYADLSGDGTIVAFGSDASTLVADDTNWTRDVFVNVLVGSPLPGRPTSLTADVRGPDVTLAWSAPLTGARADTYVIRAGFTPFATDVEFAAGTATTVGVTGVPAGTYYVRVHGRNSSGIGRPSDEAVVFVGPPGAALRLSAQVQGASVTLRWDAPVSGGPPESYLLRAGTVAGGATIEVSTGAQTASYRAEHVPAGTYFVRVHGRNAFGTGPPSNEVEFSVGPCHESPPPPTGLRATVSGRTVTLTWDALPGCAATSYVLEAGSAPGAADLYAGNIGGATRLTAIVEPRTYHVRIRGQNLAGAGPPSSEVVIVVP